MEETEIKTLLKRDLMKISTSDFNEVIIAQSSKKTSSKKNMIFTPKDLLVSFLITLLMYLALAFGWVSEPNSTTLILSLTLGLIPLFFIVFNKIYQLTIH